LARKSVFAVAAQANIGAADVKRRRRGRSHNIEDEYTARRVK
jgi:hypothetical protein